MILLSASRADTRIRAQSPGLRVAAEPLAWLATTNSALDKFTLSVVTAAVAGRPGRTAKVRLVVSVTGDGY